MVAYLVFMYKGTGWENILNGLRETIMSTKSEQNILWVKQAYRCVLLLLDDILKLKLQSILADKQKHRSTHTFVVLHVFSNFAALFLHKQAYKSGSQLPKR